MSNRSGQDRLGPNHLSYYAPRRLREGSESSASPAQIRPRPFAPIASSSFDSPLRNIASDAAGHPLATTVLAERTREKWRAALFSGVALVASVLGIWAIIAVIMAPSSRPLDAVSTSSEIPQSITSIVPQAGQGEGSKPALAQFQAILVPAPPRRDAANEQSEQLLQRFLQWRQNPDLIETSR
jgi:hypothetical protein